MDFFPKLSDVISTHFEPLLGQFKADIGRRASLLTCAPRFNYLLQASPIRIPLKYLKQFARLCNVFLWNNNHPRINLHRIQWPVVIGVIGIPNLLLYHQTFSLKHLDHWILPTERTAPWFSIENALCEDIPSFHYISAKLPKEAQAHPIFQHMQWILKRSSVILKFDPFLNLSYLGYLAESKA